MKRKRSEEKKMKRDEDMKNKEGSIDGTNVTSTLTNPQKMNPKPGMKRKRCGTCTGCKHIHDCGMCIFCKDKPKYGGLGKRKQCCELRKCIQISRKCQVNAIPPKLEEIIQPSLQSNSSPVTISTISMPLS